MSTPEAPEPPDRFAFTRAKFWGWLAGAGLIIFGGLLCAVPIGAIAGAPAVLFGLFLTISFGLSMTSGPVRTPAVLAMFTAGLALLIGGRVMADVELVARSFSVGRTQDRTPNLLNVIGMPLFLLGPPLVALGLQWLRPPRLLSYLRSGMSLFLIHAGAIALLIGAVLCRGDLPILQHWSLWTWVATPLFLGLATGLRAGPRGRIWIIVLVSSAVALPLTWFLLKSRGGWS